jgi:hypothetical protein
VDAPPTDELGRVYARSEHMVARKIADEFILVPLVGRGADLDAIYSLSKVAAFIWERLDGVRSGRQVVESVVDAFEVAQGRASVDYEELLKDLMEIGAIVEAPSTASD